MSLPAFSLQNKTALIIGACNPIGRALALALAEAGATTAISTMLPSPREVAAVQSCGNAIREMGREGFSQAIDITSETDVDALVQRTVTELGSLDILVNAPDLPFAKPAPEVSLPEWNRVLEVNLTGVYLSCRAAAGPMLQQQKGRIINVVSLLGERGMANGSAYCAAQAGVLNLTRALSQEWARQGITVNAIGAGWTEGMGMIADEALQKQLSRYVPQKRLAQPEDIGDAVLTFASEASGFITGQVLWLEGGVLSRL
jgi:NAD(P)-dependent dehydrogenase (short-subunit alcohol dehydrogenase family)